MGKAQRAHQEPSALPLAAFKVARFDGHVPLPAHPTTSSVDRMQAAGAELAKPNLSIRYHFNFPEDFATCCN